MQQQVLHTNVINGRCAILLPLLMLLVLFYVY
jgi:hypothetical protein